MDTTLSKTTRSSEDGATLRQQGDADLLSDPEVIAILKRLREGPINKNGVVKSDSGSGKDMIPYGLTTKLLAAGWIQESRRYHYGLVASAIPTWEITVEGLDAIDAIEPRTELPKRQANGPRPDWLIRPFDQFVHIVPGNELERHRLSDDASSLCDCACRPSPSRHDSKIIIHNSFDGLEPFESDKPPRVDRAATRSRAGGNGGQ